jgi:hypothetical protein
MVYGRESVRDADAASPAAIPCAAADGGARRIPVNPQAKRLPIVTLSEKSRREPARGGIRLE